MVAERSGRSLRGWASLPVWVDPIIIGVVLSTIVIVLVSWRGKISAAERLYREMLEDTPVGKMTPDELDRTRRGSLVLMVAGVVLTLLLIVFRAVPYRAAAGSAGMLHGETWVSVGCGLVLVRSGLVVRRHVGRS
jgi:sodium/pantothenate symporter